MFSLSQIRYCISACHPLSIVTCLESVEPVVMVVLTIAVSLAVVLHDNSDAALLLLANMLCEFKEIPVLLQCV